MVIGSQNTATTHSGTSRTVPENPNNIFAQAGTYIIDEAFQEANRVNHQTMGLTTDEFSKYSTPSLRNIDYNTMDEWTQSKVAQNNSNVVNFWIDNLSKGLNGRELLIMTDRATSGKNNYYKQGLDQIIAFIPNDIKNQTIQERDKDGNPTEKQITIGNILQNPNLLEQYINDPDVKSAIISGGKALKASNELNDAIKYDKRDVNALDKVAAGAHLVLGAAGAGGIVAVSGYGIAAGVIALKGAVVSGAAIWGSAFLGVALPVLGIGALVGIAVVGLVIAGSYVKNSLSEGSQYIQDGRNDNPSGTWFSGKDFACSWSWLTGTNAKGN
jgi:hypothetical protein